MRIYLVSLIFILLSAASETYLHADGSCTEKDIFSLQDFAISNIGEEKSVFLLQLWSEAEAILGEPVRVTVYPKTEGSVSDWDILYYEYNGIAISRGRGWEDVFSIGVTGHDFRTCRGIRIGDHRSTVLQKYGEKYLWKDGSKDTLSYYAVISNGRIEKYDPYTYDPVLSNSKLYLLEFEMNSEQRVVKILLSVLGGV